MAASCNNDNLRALAFVCGALLFNNLEVIKMTIMPHWKTCPRCHKQYSWNPDVGVMGCPYCMEKDRKRVEKIRKIFGKDKDQDNSDKE